MRHHVKSVVAAAAATLALTVQAPAMAHASLSAPPPLADGFGLTQIPTESTYTATNTAYDFVITVSTPQVAGVPWLDNGGHHLRIVLPTDYYATPTKRYPVLYLLNGSTPGADPANYFNGFKAVNSTSGMISVIPDGGPRGWYTNWLNQNSAAGAQNWETFHINQVIPFIDANLRTLSDKAHRAIAGISMGGFGALRYAERHPDLFSQVASLSGDNDLSRKSMDLREAAVASLVTFSPTVGSDDLFGTPYPFSLVYPYSDVLWNDANPGAHAAALKGITVSIYIGNGDGTRPIPTDDPYNRSLEWWLNSAAHHFKTKLDAAGVPSYFVDYGNGAGTAWADCFGGHNSLCWVHDFNDLIPRLQQAFTTAG